MKTRVLVVDDDASIRSVLRMALEDADMRVNEASNGKIAIMSQRRDPADIVILDIGMPERDGFETCKAIREFSDVPVLFLTARDEEIDRVLGFQLGGDDYVTKPFSPRELVLRVKAILSRGKPSNTPAPTQWGALIHNPASHEASLGGKTLNLTAMEFALLGALLAQPGQVFARDQLIHSLHGHNPHLSDRTIDSHVRNLRQKAKACGCEDLIQTVHGVGLRIGSCAL